MRPTAHRIGSLLVGLLLISSLVGPAAAAPTADTRSAATGSTAPTATTADFTMQSGGDTCDLWASVLGQCTGPLDFVRIDPESPADAIKTDLHVAVVGEWEAQQAYLTQTNNYLEDTRSIASIDSKSAIADSWVRGNTTNQASQNAREAIRDYYAMQQIQLINKYEQQIVQVDYVHNVSAQQSGIDPTFVSLGVLGTNQSDVSVDQTNYENPYQDPPTTVTVELVNGSTREVQTIRHTTWLQGDGGIGSGTSIEVDPFENGRINGSNMTFHPHDPNFPNTGVVTTGTFVVQNVGDVSNGGLPTQRVVDLREWRRTWTDIEQQSQTMTTNYDPTLTENLYAALDSGKIDPEDVRGAEGQVRWLSGNSSVGDRRFQQATLSVLDLANQNRSQANQIVVSYTGYTDLSFSNTTDGTREPVYGDYVNGTTYTGMLFANPPSGGFSAGETYNVANLEGTPTMYDNSTGQTVPLVKGNVTIEALYAANGSEVDNADWDDPQYDTYNSTRYVEYVNRSKTYRKYITNNYTTTTAGGGGGVSLPDLGLGGVPDAGDLFGGVVIMTLAGGAVVVIVLRG